MVIIIIKFALFPNSLWEGDPSLDKPLALSLRLRGRGKREKESRLGSLDLSIVSGLDDPTEL